MPRNSIYLPVSFFLLTIGGLCNVMIAQQTITLKPVKQFNESPQTHNLHIACDGKNYYTINGGVASRGQINKWTLDFQLLKTYPCDFDGRGLSFNSADGKLYASDYGGNFYRVEDAENGKFKLIHANLMQTDQCTFAFSEDGTEIWEVESGHVRVHDFKTGEVLRTIGGLSCGSDFHSGSDAIAIYKNSFFTWNATQGLIYMFDLKGKEQKRFHIEHGDLGHSLSVTNGMIWVSRDGNYDEGTWYAYPIPKVKPDKEIPVSINSTPVFASYSITGTAASIEVFNSNNERVMSVDDCGERTENFVDLHDLPADVYILRVTDFSDKVSSLEINLKE